MVKPKSVRFDPRKPKSAPKQIVLTTADLLQSSTPRKSSLKTPSPTSNDSDEPLAASSSGYHSNESDVEESTRNSTPLSATVPETGPELVFESPECHKKLETVPEVKKNPPKPQSDSVEGYVTDARTGKKFLLKTTTTYLGDPQETHVYDLKWPDPVKRIYLQSGIKHTDYPQVTSVQNFSLRSRDESVKKPVVNHRTSSQSDTETEITSKIERQPVSNNFFLHKSKLDHAADSLHLLRAKVSQENEQETLADDSPLPLEYHTTTEQLTEEVSPTEEAEPKEHKMEEQSVGLPRADVPRVHEKKNLQELNTRLSMYISHVRQIRENSHQLDSSGIIETSQMLEEELCKLKNVYEDELNKARVTSEELKLSKNQLVMESNKMRSLASDLESQLQIEQRKNGQAMDSITMLQRELLQKEQDVKNAELAIQQPIAEVENLQRMHDALLRTNQDLKRRLEKIELEREEYQDKANQTQETLDFQTKLHQNEMSEMSKRQSASNATIMELEARVREYAVAEGTMKEMLQKVREASEAELRRFQEQSAAAFNQSLAELQSQLETSNTKLREVRDENERLHEESGNFLFKTRELDAKIASLTSQRNALEDLLNNERIRARDNIEQLERKLHSLQELLISKMHEVNAARDSQLPLKAEIEAFRKMIEEEERRLRLPPTFRTEAVTGNRYSDYSQSPGAGKSFQSSRTCRPVGGVALAQHPVGPLAGSTGQRSLNLVPTSLGSGKDYFDEMFYDLKVRGDTRKSSAGASKTSSNGASNMPFNTLPKTTYQKTGPMWAIPTLPSPPHELPQYPQRRHSEPPFQTPMDKKPPVAATPEQRSPPGTPENGYREKTCSSSTTGSLQVFEVTADFVRLFNTSDKDEEIGGYIIQQNIGGHPIAVFRFPARFTFPGNFAITVWSASKKEARDHSPYNFVFEDHEKWNMGSECTTILCKPNGQAVAWYTPLPRVARDTFVNTPPNKLTTTTTTTTTTPGLVEGAALPEDEAEQSYTMGEQLTEYNMNVNAPKPDPVVMEREKDNPPGLDPPKHPYGVHPPSSVHPHTSQARPLTYGNDNSSVNRQSRGQSKRPDPIPGAPYCGASAQRMGSSMLRKGTRTTIVKATPADKYFDGTETSETPVPFQSPHARFETGLTQIMSQHHADFNPPMPRPPRFSAW